MAGRPRKPMHLHVLEGTARPGRKRGAEVQVPSGEVARPKFLKGRARKLWDEYAPVLEKMKTLTTVDAPNLAVWCVLMAEFEANGASMNASQIAQMRILADSLGMSATSRAKGAGNTQPEKPKDEAEKFFGEAG